MENFVTHAILPAFCGLIIVIAGIICIGYVLIKEIKNY
jgi:hypothetical protein